MAHVEVGAEIVTPPAKPKSKSCSPPTTASVSSASRSTPSWPRIMPRIIPSCGFLLGTTAPSDGTPTILAEYASQFRGRIRVMPDAHPTGCAKTNWLELMKAAGPGFVCRFGKMVTFSFFVSQNKRCRCGLPG
jgi:hypothetical protein